MCKEAVFQSLKCCNTRKTHDYRTDVNQWVNHYKTWKTAIRILKKQFFIKELMFETSLESCNNDVDMNKWDSKVLAGISAPNYGMKAPICLHLEILAAINS